jgi:chromosome segregation ATPase
MKKYLQKEWLIVISMIVVMLAAIAWQQVLINNTNHKLISYEQDQQLLQEEHRIKILSLNKQLTMAQNEAKHLMSTNLDLSEKLDQFKYVEHDIQEQLYKLKNQKAQLEKNYQKENELLHNKLAMANKKNSEHEKLLSELKQQVKNYKVNSYGLFQAGKLEVELAKLEQQIVEYYDNVTQKKSNITVLKDKCGKLRTNSKMCQEYDSSVETISILEKQLEHLQNKREDLKQRIHVYLSSSSHTNKD